MVRDLGFNNDLCFDISDVQFKRRISFKMNVLECNQYPESFNNLSQKRGRTHLSSECHAHQLSFYFFFLLSYIEKFPHI